MSFLEQSFEKLCWCLLHSYCRLEIHSTELPPSPFIVCSNHNSHLDTPILMLALKKHFNEFQILAAKDYFEGKENKKTFSQRVFNLLFVDRMANPIETRRLIQECRKAAANNRCLIMYPEGSRSTDGQLHAFKQGSVYIAQKLKLPIIPAAITGSGKALPKNSYFLYPQTIKVRFGTPILPKQERAPMQREHLKKITQELRAMIAALLEQNNVS